MLPWHSLATSCASNRCHASIGIEIAGADFWDVGLEQAARTQTIQQAYRRVQAAHPREDMPRPGAIRNLGLLGKEEDTREVLRSNRS